MSPSGFGGGVTGAPDITFQIWSLLRAMTASSFSDEQFNAVFGSMPAELTPGA